MVKIGRVIPEIWSRTNTHTDRQTDRHAHRNTPRSPIGGGVTRGCRADTSTRFQLPPVKRWCTGLKGRSAQYIVCIGVCELLEMHPFPCYTLHAAIHAVLYDDKRDSGAQCHCFMARFWRRRITFESGNCLFRPDIDKSLDWLDSHVARCAPYRAARFRYTVSIRLK